MEYVKTELHSVGSILRLMNQTHGNDPGRPFYVHTQNQSQLMMASVHHENLLTEYILKIDRFK